MARKFVYEDREFDDFDPNRTVEEIQQRMADHFPELANASYKKTTRGADTIYTFSKRVGTKGSDCAPITTAEDVRRVIDTLPAYEPPLLVVARDHTSPDGSIDAPAFRADTRTGAAVASARRSVELAGRINLELLKLTQ